MKPHITLEFRRCRLLALLVFSALLAAGFGFGAAYSPTGGASRFAELARRPVHDLKLHHVTRRYALDQLEMTTGIAVSLFEESPDPGLTDVDLPVGTIASALDQIVLSNSGYLWRITNGHLVLARKAGYLNEQIGVTRLSSMPRDNAIYLYDSDTVARRSGLLSPPAKSSFTIVSLRDIMRGAQAVQLDGSGSNIEHLMRLLGPNPEDGVWVTDGVGRFPWHNLLIRRGREDSLMDPLSTVAYLKSFL